ncbi:hypothetical protein ACIP27_34045 [Streptomyces hydrogenans]|uniref:hypothetical protein n=1 Tax=Streptomyces hydrogenans TaxID=1873719 RepID=UPI0038254B82
MNKLTRAAAAALLACAIALPAATTATAATNSTTFATTLPAASGTPAADRPADREPLRLPAPTGPVFFLRKKKAAGQ